MLPPPIISEVHPPTPGLIKGTSTSLTLWMFWAVSLSIKTYENCPKVPILKKKRHKTADFWKLLVLCSCVGVYLYLVNDPSWARGSSLSADWFPLLAVCLSWWIVSR